MSNVGQDLLNVPFADMVLKLALAIAEGQYKMDQVSCKIAKLMGDENLAPVYLPDLTKPDEDSTIKTSLIGAGFQPTFYQFTDTIIEVRMAISMNQTTDKSGSVTAEGGWGVFSASVNASYSSKYSYSVEGSSLLRTKITPLQPNGFMQQILDMRAEILQHELKMRFLQAEMAIAENRQELQAAEEEAGIVRDKGKNSTGKDSVDE